MGYIGSVILLLFNLAMVLYPNWFGIQGNKEEASELAMRISFVTVGIWWALFSQYSFYYLPKGISKEGKVIKDVLFNGFKELIFVWNQLK